MVSNGLSVGGVKGQYRHDQWCKETKCQTNSTTASWSKGLIIKGTKLLLRSTGHGITVLVLD